MKRRKTCERVLPLDQFYEHPQTKDGRLSSCKDRRKTYERERQHASDPAWVEKERARGREKYHRLGYVTAVKRRRTAAPCLLEQRRAYNLCQHVPCPEGYQRHHWSYREEHALDILLLSQADHYSATRLN